MRNVEIKTRLIDLSAAEAVARRLAGPEPHARLHQVDTYFRVPEGRLKLRETEGAGAELVFYRRPDSSGPRRCDYEIAPVQDPAALKRLLASAFGARAIVNKRRTVYLYRGVRIHLDRVKGLGDFLEFEAVMPEGVPDSEGEALVREMVEEFSIRPEDLIGESYADMVERAG